MENILDTKPVKIFLSLFNIEYDLNQKGVVPAFDTWKNMIYAIDMTISPMIFILIIFFRMKPFKWAFVVPIYGYLNMLIGTITLAKNIDVTDLFDLWWYRAFILFGAVIICWVLTKSIKYFDAEEKSEEIKNMIIENYRLQLQKNVA